MRKPLLSIKYVERALSDGSTERLVLHDGVNLIIGVPNTGKTKWMQTLDYVLGDSGEQPFASETEDFLADKYVSMSACISFDEDEDITYMIGRRWREPGAKSKVFIDNEPKSTKEFQHWMLEKLDIPLLNFPKGNPMSGQTWPELSFRSMYRHLYRRQTFWSDLVDKQPEAELLACIQNFLGLADQIYTDDYGELIDLRRQVEKLEARKDQYSDTLNDLARDLVDDDNLSVSVTSVSIAKAKAANINKISELEASKESIVNQATSSEIDKSDKSRIETLAKQRSELVLRMEQRQENLHGMEERIAALRQLRNTLVDEIDRIGRASDASEVLSDLKITHCPSCDQNVSNAAVHLGQCGLCHQEVVQPVLTAEIGKERIKFESDRLSAEVKEAEELLSVAISEHDQVLSEARDLGEDLKRIELQLKPARAAVGALVQENISQIDLEIGQLNERNIQLERVESAVGLDVAIATKITDLEDKIKPLAEAVKESQGSADFEERAAWLEEGMNEYLNAINAIRPDSWKHSPLGVYLSKSTFTLRIGDKRWKRLLGGTDTLFVLMAYQYGLLSLIRHDASNFPGLIIIDTPAEFIGEALGDGLNFIVQPFIDLLSEFNDGGQVIMTGASFDGIENASEIKLKTVHVV